MANEIDIKRAEIKQYFDESVKIAGSNEYGLSEYGLYYFETQQYKQKGYDQNWVVTKIQIGQVEKNEFLFEYLTDNDNSFFAWVYKEGKDYLLFPEFQGGQSVFDVEERKLYSYYSESDSFIWTNILISPDKNKLAVTGCYWACPYEIVIDDCSDIKKLPYHCIYRQVLDEGFEVTR
jgi:hypothetical protein